MGTQIIGEANKTSGFIFDEEEDTSDEPGLRGHAAVSPAGSSEALVSMVSP